ncbi:MAG: hypothetical protein ACFFEX_17360 [Candidatus Thorarchaeota archaeon]
MRKLVIKLPKASYTPGEEISGSLEVICDKPFDSNGTTISIQGIMEVKGESYPDAPKDKIIIETKTLVQALLGEAILLSPPRRYEAGTHKFNFSFHLPPSTCRIRDNLEISSGIFPSYDGRYASIEYSIQAEIEVSRFRNVKTKTPLSIIIPVERTSKRLQMHVVEKGEEIVEFETDTRDLCIGSPLELRCRFNSYQLISKVQFEIIHNESTRVEYARNVHSQTYCKVDVRPRKQDIGKWQTLVLEPKHNMPQSFRTKHVRSEAVLKVTVQLTDRSKKESLVRLMAIRCSPRKVQTEVPKHYCPHCQEELSDISGVVRPDGSVICPKCFKRFTPQNL